MTWHATDQQLTRWLDSNLGGSSAMSVDRHVQTCETCRHRCSTLETTVEIEDQWSRLLDRIEAPEPSRLELLASRLGLSDTTIRLLAATPALRIHWLFAVAIVVLLAALAAEAGRADPGWLFLTLAPAAPVLGIGLAYGPGNDPMYEVEQVAPLHGLRVLFTRAVAVLAFSIAVATAAAFLVPGVQIGIVAWLLPALSLSGLTLALETVVTPRSAAAGICVSWAALVGWLARPGGRADILTSPLLHTALTIVLVASLGIIAVRRTSFDLQDRAPR